MTVGTACQIRAKFTDRRQGQRGVAGVGDRSRRSVGRTKSADLVRAILGSVDVTV
jgi:hypothetical protein